MADPAGYPGIPRWVKVQAVFVAILLLLIVAMSTGLIGIGGGHGAAMGGH